MSCSSAAEAGVVWFRFVSGAVHVGVSSPEPVVVSSSSVSSAKSACSSYVHRDRDVVHASRCIGGVEAIWVLLVVESPIWVSLKVLLKVRERATAESSRLELWAWDVGRITTLLFQYIVKEFLAPSDLYSTLFQFSEVARLWSFDNVF